MESADNTYPPQIVYSQKRRWREKFGAFAHCEKLRQRRMAIPGLYVWWNFLLPYSIFPAVTRFWSRNDVIEGGSSIPLSGGSNDRGVVGISLFSYTIKWGMQLDTGEGTSFVVGASSTVLSVFVVSLLSEFSSIFNQKPSSEVNSRDLPILSSSIRWNRGYLRNFTSTMCTPQNATNNQAIHHPRWNSSSSRFFR